MHHGGTNNSWYALVWIAPELGFAALGATNIGGDAIFSKIDAVIWAVIQDHLAKAPVALQTQPGSVYIQG